MARRFQIALLVVAGLVAAACGGKTGASKPMPQATPPATPPSAAGTWAYPNGNLANTRVAAGSTITAANVGRLRQAWTFKLTGSAAAGVERTGSLAMNPIVTDGRVYIQDLDCNVYALSLATGRLEWEHQLNTPEQTGPGPNGVAVAGGTVYGDSPTSVFALNARTGATLWVDNGLLRAGEGTFEIQPQVANGRVYLASAYGSGPGGGVLLALDASTGRPLWRFHTVIGPTPGVGALGLGSGGAWQTPLVGADGSVSFGIGNPYQSPASAAADPSRQLYTDSEVNVDASSGRLRWYYQAVPNDFKDYDMQASPIAADIDGHPVVIGGGKMGDVYAMAANTGRLIWKTPVGEHNGHDDDSILALEHRTTLKAPYTFAPGALGGVLTNLALAGDTVYAAVIDLPFTFERLSQVDGVPAGRAAGEIDAVDLATGKIEWATKVADVPLGAATVSNDLVFTTLSKGVLIALNRNTGAIVYRRQLPDTTNAPIAIAGNTVLVPAAGPQRPGRASRPPQLVAYTAP